MVVNRCTHEECWQKRENIGLQECDKKLQDAKKSRTEDTDHSYSCPGACRSRGSRRNQSHNAEKYEVTGNHIRQQTNCQNQMFDAQSEYFNQEETEWNYNFQWQHVCGHVNWWNLIQEKPNHTKLLHAWKQACEKSYYS